jgi:hypothetical protein
VISRIDDQLMLIAPAKSVFSVTVFASAPVTAPVTWSPFFKLRASAEAEGAKVANAQ